MASELPSICLVSRGSSRRGRPPRCHRRCGHHRRECRRRGPGVAGAHSLGADDLHREFPPQTHRRVSEARHSDRAPQGRGGSQDPALRPHWRSASLRATGMPDRPALPTATMAPFDLHFFSGGRAKHSVCHAIPRRTRSYNVQMCDLRTPGWLTNLPTHRRL